MDLTKGVNRLSIGVLKIGGSFIHLDDLQKTMNNLRAISSYIILMLKEYRYLWIVQSAVSGVTRRLGEIAHKLDSSHSSLIVCLSEIEQILNSHLIFCKNINPNYNSKQIVDRLSSDIAEKLTSNVLSLEDKIAFIESLGEKMAVDLILMPYLESEGYSVGRMNAEKLVFAINESPQRDADIDLLKTRREVMALIERMMEVSEVSGVEGVTIPAISAIEGFIGSFPDRRTCTFGYDGSDLTAVVLAHMCGTEPVLLKNMDRKLSTPVMSELFREMGLLSGDKGRIVGLKALHYALWHRLGGIVLSDPNTGYKVRLLPKM